METPEAVCSTDINSSSGARNKCITINNNDSIFDCRCHYRYCRTVCTTISVMIIM